MLKITFELKNKYYSFRIRDFKKKDKDKLFEYYNHAIKEILIALSLSKETSPHISDTHR